VVKANTAKYGESRTSNKKQSSLGMFHISLEREKKNKFQEDQTINVLKILNRFVVFAKPVQ